MVVRGWPGAIATAAGAAAAASAAQLGLAYGMDIISWPAMVGARADEAWTAGLTWAAWVAASSTIVGAIVTDRLAHRPEPGGTLLWRGVLAAAAALGAAATVVLIAVPARVAEVSGVVQPQTAAAGRALFGVVVGLALTFLALRSRAVTVNLIATGGWLWALAVVAVIDGVLADRGWARVPLGFWDLQLEGPWFRSLLLPDVGIAVGAALVIGLLAALPAVRRGDSSIGVATSGAAGPLLVAAAYLLAQPQLVDATAVDLSRQLTVPYLIGVGLAGSLLATLLHPRGTQEEADQPADSDLPEPDNSDLSQPAEDAVSEAPAAIPAPRERGRSRSRKRDRPVLAGVDSDQA